MSIHGISELYIFITTAHSWEVSYGALTKRNTDITTCIPVIYPMYNTLQV